MKTSKESISRFSTSFKKNFVALSVKVSAAELCRLELPNSSLYLHQHCLPRTVSGRSLISHCHKLVTHGDEEGPQTKTRHLTEKYKEKRTKG